MHSPELMSVTKEVSQSFQAPFVPEPCPDTGGVPAKVGQVPVLFSLKQLLFPVISALPSTGVNTASTAGRFHIMAMISRVTPLNRRLNENEECMCKSMASLLTAVAAGGFLIEAFCGDTVILYAAARASSRTLLLAATAAEAAEIGTLGDGIVVE